VITAAMQRCDCPAQYRLVIGKWDGSDRDEVVRLWLVPYQLPLPFSEAREARLLKIREVGLPVGKSYLLLWYERTFRYNKHKNNKKPM
jgi:hypothetical protein